MATNTARGAEEFVPAEADLPKLKQAAASCQGCDLYQNATQTVFGDGDSDAKIMLMGEVPGDREDREGQPFVGPAGKLLARALEEAEIERSTAYVTNVVKHFKFTERGKRRIHQKPNTTEIVACHRWIEAELAALAPSVVVMMGTVAVRSVLGRSATIRSLRDTEVELDGMIGIVTVHPAAILRARSDRAPMMAGFVDDLRRAAQIAQERA
jgi:DNA polymerase